MARKRRPKGTGSVYKTAQRGYVAQREIAPNGGKRRYERHTFPTKGDATRQAAAWEREALALDAHADAGATVQDWLVQWLASKQHSVSPRAHEFLERHLDYTIPFIGDVRLFELTPAHCRAMLSNLAEDLSPQSCAHIHTVLKQALQLAVNDGVIPKNPMATVEKPKVTKYRIPHSPAALHRTPTDTASQRPIRDPAIRIPVRDSAHPAIDRLTHRLT